MADPKKVPQNREEGIQKGIDEAYALKSRIIIKTPSRSDDLCLIPLFI